MASDLPETHRSSRSMARALASYMKCPDAIRREVRAQFLDAPAVDEIRRMQARHVKDRTKRAEAPFKPHEGYWPTDMAETLEATNKRFVAALKLERVRPRLLVIRERVS